MAHQMEVELDKFRAASAGKLEEQIISQVVVEVQSLQGETRSADVVITSSQLVIHASDARRFTGAAPPDIHNASAHGVLNSRDLATLYRTTILYTFRAGPLDTIEFRDAGNALLGTWTGKFNALNASSFTYPGTWA